MSLYLIIIKILTNIRRNISCSSCMNPRHKKTFTRLLIITSVWQEANRRLWEEVGDDIDTHYDTECLNGRHEKHLQRVYAEILCFKLLFLKNMLKYIPIKS